MDWVIALAVLAILGLIVGALAKFLMPGDDPGGIVTTSILGVLGAIVGGVLANALEIGGITGFDWRSLVTAVGGSLLLLLAYRAFRMLTTGSSSSAYASGRSTSSNPLRAYGAEEEHEPSAVTNLADVAQQSMTDEIMNRLGEKVGESPSAVRKAMEAMIPTVLASARSLASTPSGASKLFDLAKGAVQGGVEKHLVEGDLEAVGRQSHGILNALFGDKLAGLLRWLSRFAGIKETSASTLMNVASSLAMGSIGRTIQKNGLDASQLGRLLSSQSGWLSRLLPSGIGDVPGMRSLAELGDRAAEAGRTTMEAGRRAGATAQGAYRDAVGAARDESPLLAALLPLGLLLLPLLLFTWFMRGAASTKPVEPQGGLVARQAPVMPRAVETPATRPAPDQLNVAATSTARAPDPSRPETIDSRPLVPTSLKLTELRLPDGATLKVAESSFLNEIYKYLSDATATKARSFVFKGLEFDGHAIRSLPETETAVTNLHTLLHAFPSTTLRIEGHTDSSGDAEADRKESLKQADALKELLVKAGAPGDRITTAGLGSEKPVAANDITEGREKNRRIEVSLSKSP